MYKRTIVLVAVLICATVILAVFLIGQAHRYDIVAVAAGSGGSTDERGDLSVEEWLIDHKTGQVWSIHHDKFMVPIHRMSEQEAEGK